MFMLIFDWINETDGLKYCQDVNWYDTREELLEAYQKYSEYFKELISIGRLYLHFGIEYDLKEIKQMF